MKRVVIDIRASKNILGLVKFSVTSPAGLMNFFLNVESCNTKRYHFLSNNNALVVSDLTKVLCIFRRGTE